MVVKSEVAEGQALPAPPSSEGLIAINLSDLEAETRCPVCLGVIKNARLVSGCMHRFCAECIEKWLRVCRENNCPQCRMPMQSRRDCKKDGKYDRLLRLLYDDIQKYETEMLDADDAILEQAMQTGAALKRARDLQKAARKPKVENPPATGYVRSDSTSPRKSVHWDGQQGQGSFQQPQGPESKGPYRSVGVGQLHWPTRPPVDSKPELPEVPTDQLHQHTTLAGDSRSGDGRADPSSSTGQFLEQPQGQLQTAFQDQSQMGPLQHRSADSQQATSTKRDPDTDSGTDRRPHHQQRGKQKADRPGQHQKASSRPPSRGPIGSPAAKIVSLSSLQPQAAAQQAPAQRAITVGMPSFPVGSTTGIIGRSWPGQPQFANPTRAGPGDGKGTKRPAGEGESKGKKRQRRNDREKSVDGDGRQSTGPIAAFLRPLPPSQPEEEAKAQAASLAATAAAAAKQQEVTLHGVIQVCLLPEAEVSEGRALPVLEKPFLKCPAEMQVQELQKLVATQAHHEDPSSVQLRIAANDDGQFLPSQQVLAELQQPHEQHVALRYSLRPDR